MRKIGITSTVPVEVVYAAGCVPVDLNNIFVNAQNPEQLVSNAEYQGYPRNSCGWIKGIYSVAAEGGFDAVISVVEGDCSQTQAMVETLQVKGIEIIPFSYPYGRDRKMLQMQVEKLISTLGTTMEETTKWKTRLDRIRKKVRMLDELTWQNGSLSSFENHYYQICCSDFNSDPDSFEQEIDAKLVECKKTKTTDSDEIRLGYIGVPPIFTDFYEYIEKLGVKIVFNEVQRQFAMPYDTEDIVDQYLLYTYPYDIFARIEDIKKEIKTRKIDGIVHYTQSFCFRQIQDMIIRKSANIPVLTLEGDAPCPLDARTRVRLESFIEMLS